MIHFIAAMDSKRGIATDAGIPWQGQVPGDVAQFRAKTLHSNLLMGSGWYAEQKLPLPDRRNFVATSNPQPLREGFERVSDARTFLQQFDGDMWVGGGAGLFASTLDLADQLHLTHLEGDWHCTKFFPEFMDQFQLVEKSEPMTENDITYYFARYSRLPN